MNEVAVSLQDVANIVGFVAPGYFAIQVYSLIYAKRDRDFPRLLVESVVFSLPIVALANVVWESILRQPEAANLNGAYAVVLLAVAILCGVLATWLRKRWPLKDLALSFGLGSPNSDFVKTQLERIDVQDPSASSVTVALKNGAIFSGTADQISSYTQDGPLYYSFSNLAWYNSKTSRWQVRAGNIIIERSEIDYIVTPPLRDDETKARLLPRKKHKKRPHA